MSAKENGWAEYQRQVLGDLARLERSIEDLREDVRGLSTATADLKAKSTVWGVIGGSIPLLLSMLVYLFMRR